MKADGRSPDGCKMQGLAAQGAETSASHRQVTSLAGTVLNPHSSSQGLPVMATLQGLARIGYAG